MIDFGIVRPGTILYVPFSSYGGSTGASITLTGLAVTDIEIYKDGSVTQRASDSGYALLDTDGIDFDGTTGIHGFSVDLADNATANFYAAGSQYWIIVSSVTVDSQTVNFIAATFQIGYPDAVLNTTIATLASQTSFTLTAGPAEDDALNGCQVVIHDVASAVQVGRAVILDYTGATKTVTLAAGTTFTAAAGDNIAVLGLAPLQPTTDGRKLDVSTGGEAGVDWANVGSPATTVGLSGTTVKTATDVETDTVDIQSRLPAALVFGRMDSNMQAAAAGVITAAVIATGAIDADALAADAGTEIGGAVLTALGTGTWATAIPWNAAWDAEVQSEVNDELVLQNLDHLLKVAAVAGDVADSSVIARLASKSATPAFTSYNNTTDSLEAISDATSGTVTVYVTAAAVSAEPPVSARLTIYKTATFGRQITGLGTITNRTKLYVTIKELETDTDAEAMIKLEESAGLTIVNGASYATTSHGSITVNDATAGDITIAIDEAVTTNLVLGRGYVYDVKVVRSTGAVDMLTKDFADVLSTVTKAVS